MLHLLLVSALESALFTGQTLSPSADNCMRQRPPLKKMATRTSHRPHDRSEPKRTLAVMDEKETHTRVPHKRSSAEGAQSINEASHVVMAPSRRDTAMDIFAPRMAVDTTPQDSLLMRHRSTKAMGPVLARKGGSLDIAFWERKADQ